MNLEEAKDLFERETEHYQEFCDSVFPDIITADTEALTEEERQEYLSRKGALKQLTSQFMADPELFPHMMVWMVDIVGGSNKTCKCHQLTEEIFVEEPELANPLDDINDEFIDHNDMREVIAKVGGASMQRIKQWLIRSGYHVTDSGGGGGSWHLGSYCTQQEADRLCREAREYWSEEFAAGELRMKRMPWSVKFK